MATNVRYRLGVIIPDEVKPRETSPLQRQWWDDNYRRNSERFKSSPPKGVKGNFEEAFLNMPGFLVAAGPSLDKNIEHLKLIKGKCPIFTVDGALPSLIKSGIRPDFVISVEGDAEVGWFWEDLDTKGLTLICSTVSSPDALETWQGDVYFTNAWISDTGEYDLGKLWSGGNVSTVMMSFAVGMCFINPTIFVGHDFSFKEKDPGFYFPENGVPVMEEQANRIIHNSRAVTDINGDKVYTTPDLLHACNWTEQALLRIYQLERDYTVFVNATEGGILGANLAHPRPVERINLSQAIDKYCKLQLGRI